MTSPAPRATRNLTLTWLLLEGANLAFAMAMLNRTRASAVAWILVAALIGLLVATLRAARPTLVWTTLTVASAASLMGVASDPAAQTSLMIVVIATAITLRGRWRSYLAAGLLAAVTLAIGWTHSPGLGINLAVNVLLAGVGATAMTDLVGALHTVERLRDADVARARADERLRLARELHETAAQHVAIALRSLEYSDPQHQLTSVHRELADALESLRRIDEPPPPSRLLDELARARERLATASIATTFDTHGIHALDPATDEHLAWILREAVANVIRHSGATTAAISIRYDPESTRLTLSVHDDGVGLHGAPGAGLRAVEAHAAAIGARWSLGSEPPGTWLRLERTQSSEEIVPRSL
ncbi:putative signal transduction histidine kinase [Acidimicrobium ferrooxidans DSM 10331]|uniref:histidine kinase n=1 Tax=Acidimicrobium ferrooxidans (strain DSM 10331 / JCM 15462 / NBRC 103882 / ICP) TaxID=525909 RepID=C7M2R7_ACIFD|nr:signal transduction histidine kinase [Acidimicrobium ferrooxidans]ACU53311.1 putative signal transduction histidine kinase [Acidimicrobium ferrooxidans DSM 10331]